MRLAGRRTAALALAGMLAVGLGACGDDGDGDDAADAAPSADDGELAAAEDNQEFCDAFTATDQAMTNAPEDSAEMEAYAAAEITPHLGTVRDTAPDSLSEPVGVMVDAVETMLADGDFGAFETPEFLAAQGEVYPALGDTCGLPTVTATAVDFRYEGVPETVEAGLTVFVIDNQSAAGEAHEMGVVRLKDDVTLSAEEILALSEEEAQQYIEAFGGGMYAPAGEVGGTTVDLAPGRYLYACFIPTGSVNGQEGTGAPHFTEGMFGEFTVE
jgi:hypothetical protein